MYCIAQRGLRLKGMWIVATVCDHSNKNIEQLFQVLCISCCSNEFGV